MNFYALLRIPINFRWIRIPEGKTGHRKKEVQRGEAVEEILAFFEIRKFMNIFNFGFILKNL
jgi:hypothetical protein